MGGLEMDTCFVEVQIWGRIEGVSIPLQTL